MRGERLRELKDFVSELCSYERSFYSPGIKKAKYLVRSFLKGNKIRFFEEKFYVSKSVPLEGEIICEDRIIKAITYGGSAVSDEEGIAVFVDFMKNGNVDFKDKVVISPEGGMPVWKKAEMVKKGGGKALVTFVDGIDTLFVGNARNTKIPVLNVRKSDAYYILGKKVKIKPKVSSKSSECSNIYFDVGRGPYIYVVAHIDTKPFTNGAIDNGVSVALLLFIARELKLREEDMFCRIRFLITDCEEFGLEGASFHVKNTLKHTYYAINVDSVGWHNPAVIYKDSYGYNDEELMDKFYKHISDFGVDIPFRESKTGVSDHVVFKREGIKSMFLSSNPFTLRHTEMDTYELIAWDKVEMWHDLLVSFLRRFDRL